MSGHWLIARRRYVSGSLVTISFLWLVTLTGCEGGALRPAGGTVKLPDGSPLVGAQVVFRPQSDEGVVARGQVGPDGAFQLGTYKPGDGAVPGTYSVLVTPLVPFEVLEDAAAFAAYRPPIDPRYQKLDTTPLEFTVAPNANNYFEIVVEPPRSRRR